MLSVMLSTLKKAFPQTSKLAHVQIVVDLQKACFLLDGMKIEYYLFCLLCTELNTFFHFI